jgi:Protein of unknown function (DUF1553)/Protein of unknown function (DUF1549)/Planctomycete cytochrome C/Concanavalin A-like lectin/glucanases superfamily
MKNFSSLSYKGRLCRTVVIGLARCLLLSVALQSQAQVQFNRDIRPILSDNCFHCHGPDKDDREADLRLDTAAGIVKDLGGYQAVVPGDAQKSELYQRIIHIDPEQRMPPQEAHKHLTDQQVQLLEQWIREGAPWEEHWAFEPIKKPLLATIETDLTHPDWVKTPIDVFIMNRLDGEQLTPSERADKRTLIRRVTFDLTGVPPTPEQVEAFVADSSVNAYEKLVDRLLATKAYAEHRTSHWLDVARYADTHGFHLDNYRSIWPYRDWVISAFNQNMPFDQFTVDQLAGDMLPASNLQQKVATGFHRSNPTTAEGGAIDDEYLAIYAKDRAETTSAVWLGLTVGCATCHDHKYDPITQKEFYQFTAFFRNTTQPAMDGNAFDSYPFVKVPTQDELKREADIKDKINAEQSAFDNYLKASHSQFEQWLSSGGTVAHQIPVAQAQTEVVSAKTLSLTPQTRIDLGDVGKFNLKDSFSGSLWLRVPKNINTAQTLIQRLDPGKEGVGWNVRLSKKAELKFSVKSGKKTQFSALLKNGFSVDTWHHLVFIYDGGAGSNSLSIIIDGESQTLDKVETVDLTQLQQIALTESPLLIGSNKKVDKKPTDKDVFSVGIQDVRVFKGVLTHKDVQSLYQVPALKKIRQLSPEQLSQKQRSILYRYYLGQIEPKGQQTLATLRQLQLQLSLLQSRIAVSLVMEEKKGETPEAQILHRGLYDQPGERVTANVPAVLPPLAQHDSQPQNRLTLARWLVDGKNPLTARVTVNRFWQSVFGTGLVKTAGDFGSQGEPPSHPLLLDWLAAEFMDSGWNIKQLFKLMVMSATYQQSSVASPELLQKDVKNRLLARGPRMRLSAEAIRDQALSVSGLLVDKVGGPPVKPYQPQGIWKAVAYVGSNTMVFHQDHNENLYRKSLYTFRKRTAAPPSMSIFDAPSRESCTVKRETTNTPLQALLLMNDPQFVEAARYMAEKMMRISGDNNKKFETLLDNALGRKPDADMVAVLQQTYNQVLSVYQQKPQAAKALINIGESVPDPQLSNVELAAWTVVVNQVFNLHEFITKN